MRALRDGQVQYYNMPAREMLASFGWNEGELLPKSMLLAVERISEKGEKQFEVEITCPNKRVFSMVLASSATEDWINLYGRDITDRRKAEAELAKTQLELKKKIEEQLSESYIYLGLVNRKISMLLELEDHSLEKKNKQEIVDYILNSAVSLSRAKTGFLYTVKNHDKFDLISSCGLVEVKADDFKQLNVKDVNFIAELVREKKRLNGPCALVDANCFSDNFDFSYFVALPILSRNSCAGFIFLGFTGIKSMDADELQFLDVFSKHVSIALGNAGILE
jgi:hypothetical protein